MICTKAVKYFIFVLIAASAAADESPDKQTPQNLNRSVFKKSLFKDCGESYSLTCLKLDIVSWVDKLDENEAFSVFPGISVVKENVSDSASTKEVLAEVGRAFPSDPSARVDAYLTRKVLGYFNSHSIKFNFGSAEDAINTSDAASPRKGGGGGGGFGGGKGGGGLGYLLAAGGMMKGTLMAIGMGALAALAGKALMAAMMSLMMSAIVGLKSLSHGGDHKESYEVIAKPIHHDHYRRSFGGL